MWRKISFGAILAAAMLLTAAEAEPARRLKGAVVGGVASHFAGHHGFWAPPSVAPSAATPINTIGAAIARGPTSRILADRDDRACAGTVVSPRII